MDITKKTFSDFKDDRGEQRNLSTVLVMSNILLECDRPSHTALFWVITLSTVKDLAWLKRNKESNKQKTKDKDCFTQLYDLDCLLAVDLTIFK